jgi:hypothetical protein
MPRTEADPDASGRGALAYSLDAPSLPEAVIHVLKKALRDANCYLEFGAGGSTLLAIRLGVAEVISVESDADFLRTVVHAADRLNAQTRLHAVHVDIGRTGAWGRPVNKKRVAHWPRYPQAGFVRAAELGLEPDFVLIDGRFRVACFLATLICARPDTAVLFDDYATRDKYQVVETFVKPERIIDRVGLFRVPADIDGREAAFALARYSLYYKW